MDIEPQTDTLAASFDLVARQDAAEAAIGILRGDVDEVKARLDRVSRAASRPILDGASPDPEVKSFVDGYLRKGRATELKSINDRPVIKVTIDSVNYEVVANTLNVATPELKVLVAPTSVVDPKSPEAIEIGTIPSVEAGATVGSTPIVFNASGRAKLVEMMSTYKTPFNVMVGSTLTVTAGQMVPEGKLDAVIRIRAHAGL